MIGPKRGRSRNVESSLASLGLQPVMPHHALRVRVSASPHVPPEGRTVQAIIQGALL